MRDPHFRRRDRSCISQQQPSSSRSTLFGPTAALVLVLHSPQGLYTPQARAWTWALALRVRARSVDGRPHPRPAVPHHHCLLARSRGCLEVHWPRRIDSGQPPPPAAPAGVSAHGSRRAHPRNLYSTTTTSSSTSTSGRLQGRRGWVVWDTCFFPLRPYAVLVLVLSLLVLLLLVVSAPAPAHTPPLPPPPRPSCPETVWNCLLKSCTAVGTPFGATVSVIACAISNAMYLVQLVYLVYRPSMYVYVCMRARLLYMHVHYPSNTPSFSPPIILHQASLPRQYIATVLCWGAHPPT